MDDLMFSCLIVMMLASKVVENMGMGYEMR
jgi:hypothetical protein